MEAMVLLTDAYGGYGGIAKFNRDLLEALSADGRFSRITALPRLRPEGPLEPKPEALDYRIPRWESKWRYGVHALYRAASHRRSLSLLICAHIHLLPLLRLCARLSGARLVLIVHGIDAWKPPGPNFARWSRSVDAIFSVSRFTADRFSHWSGFDRKACYILPNVVDVERFKPGAPPSELKRRLGLEGCRVILTVGRLASRERTKGFDQTIEVVARLKESLPDLAYLIVGKGDDRERLQQKASDLGVSDRVHFAGYVSEAEKPLYYLLADLFVMPSSTEGFGITYLEALACGVPVIGGDAGGAREVLQGMERARVVPPANCQALEEAILEMLKVPTGLRPEKLFEYTASRFREKLRSYLDDLL